MLIKDYYDMSYIETIGTQIKALYPDFPLEAFIADMQEALGDQSYSTKMTIIAKSLHRHLPGYVESLPILTAMLGEKLTSMKEMYEQGKPYAPFGKYIECYASQHEEAFAETIAYIYELTQRYTGEFAMRPLLDAFPDQTVAVLQTWVTSESDFVRRLCSECMRVRLPWAKTLTFALENFDSYCAILLQLANDPNAYVRRSVANNLNDLYKVDRNKAASLQSQLENLQSPQADAIIKHGTRWARKQGLL